MKLCSRCKKLKPLADYNKYTQAHDGLQRYCRVCNSLYREHINESRRLRRLYAIEYLGGKCVDCNSDEQLELDHIDPNTKIISSKKFHNLSNRDYWIEVEKCQLLCKDCHIIKTRDDRCIR